MNADATYLIPDKVSYEQAAPIFCAAPGRKVRKSSVRARPKSQ
jgi:hypothetical protein